MACHSVITLEKPANHLGLSDWHARLTQIRHVADAVRNESFEMRHDARTLRNETRIKSDWDTYNNNARLSDRIAEVNRWRITVETCLQRIEREMKLLEDEKASTERELDAMITPLLVVSDCLTTRDCRLEPELTYDCGDVELQRELCIVENNLRILRDQCQVAWEKLNRLAEVKFKLELEITDKREAEEIDTCQLDLNKFSGGITFKTSPTRIPKRSCTYNGWREHTEHIKHMADDELADTYALRESLFVAREKARNILRAQQEKTEYVLRKRIFETQKSRNELDWQKLKMNEEMGKCLAEIKSLEEALRDKTDCLKLAETRLENRAQRSGIELCCDDPYEGLCDEVHQLRCIRSSLNDQIDAAKTTYTTLEDHARKIETDLNLKQHSLMTDIRGLDLRNRLRSGELDPCNAQTSRNIQLTKMESEIPSK